MADFLQNNWFWIVLAVLFIGMHSFGGGCCGGSHRRRKKNAEDASQEDEAKGCH
jgi:hypothetical protein